MKKNKTVGAIYLIGGGSLVQGMTYHIEYDIVKSINKKKIYIAMINFAYSTDFNNIYINKFKRFYGEKFPEYIFCFEEIKYNEEMNTSFRKLQKADVIYLGGGSPIRLYSSLKEKGLYSYIISEVALGKTLVGRSAGASVLAESYMTGGLNKTPQIRSGFGLIPLLICCHFSQRNRKKYFVKRLCEKKCNGLGLDEGACMKISAKKITFLLGENKPSEIYCYETKTNKEGCLDVQIESILPGLEKILGADGNHFKEFELGCESPLLKEI